MISKLFGQLPSLRTSLKIISTTSSQLSMAVGFAGSGTLSQSKVRSSGIPVKVGAWSSRIVRIWLAVVVLPQLSVAVQVRMISKLFGQFPSLRTSSKIISTTSSQLSVTVGFAGSGKLSRQENYHNLRLDHLEFQ